MNQDKHLYHQLLTLALPIMAANFLQTLYNLVDTYYLGRLGREAVAAPSIAFNIILFLVVFGIGYAMAATTLISQAKGDNNQELVDFYAGQICTVMLTMSIIIGVAGYLLTVPMLKLMQVPDDVFPHVRVYMEIIFIGMPFMFISFILKGILQGIGDSMTPLKIQGLTVLLNVVLDPLFIFGLGVVPAMGVAGAALATILSRAVGSAIAVYILLKGKKGVHIRARHLIPRKDAFLLMSRIGFPSSVGQGLSSLGFTVLQGIVNTLGAAVIAAYGVGGRIIGIFNMPAMGMGQATAVMVGQRLGARKHDEAKRVVTYAVRSILVFIIAGMTLTFFRGKDVVRFFIDDPEVIAHGAELFRIVSVSVVFFALFMVLNGAFQGGGDTKPMMVMNILRLWALRLPLAYLFVMVLDMGAVGIWWAMFTSNFVVAGITLLLYRTGRWIRMLLPEAG